VPEQLLRNMPDIDGIFCANDQMAAGALKALQGAGKRVPEDIKVIGYDDVFIANVMQPSLSTIHVQKYRLGKKAAELLFEQIDAAEGVPREAAVVEMPYSLVTRSSTVKNHQDDSILSDW